MKSIEKRLSALETRLVPASPRPVIRYIYDEEGGEKEEARARAEATAEWEEANGPLGDVEPRYIARCIVLPNAPGRCDRPKVMEQG